MSRLPEFTATGVFTEQEVVSTASQGQSLTALGQRVASIGEKIFREGAIKRAQDLGEVAGLQENLRPKPAFTDAQRAFNKAAIEAHKGILATDLTRNAEQIRHEVWTAEIARPNPSAKHALNSFTTRWAAYMQTTMANVPAGNRAFAFNYGNNQGARHQMFFQNQEIAQATRMTQMEYAASDSAWARAIENQAAIIPHSSGDADLKIETHNGLLWIASQRIESAKKARMANVISEAQSENIIKQTNELVRDLPIVGNYRLALQRGEGSKFIKDLNAKGLPDAKPLWARITAETAHWRQAQGVSDAQGELSGQQAITVAKKTGIKNNAQLAFAQAHLSKKAFDKVLLGVNNGVTTFNATKSLLKLSPSVQTALIDEETASAKADNDVAAVANLLTIKNNIKDEHTKLASNPVQFNIDNPEVRKANAAAAINIPLERNQVATMGASGNLPAEPNADEEQQLAQTHEGRTPNQTRVLKTQEAAALGAQINQATTQEQFQTILQEAQRKHPGFTQKIFNDLVVDGFISHGTVYRMMVPNTFTYQAELNEAFSQPEKSMIDNLGAVDEAKLQAAKTNLLVDTPVAFATGVKDTVIGISRVTSAVTLGFLPKLRESIYNEWQNYRATLPKTGTNDAMVDETANGITRGARVLMVNKGISASNAIRIMAAPIAEAFHYVSLDGQELRWPKGSNIARDHLVDYLNDRKLTDITRGNFRADTTFGTARVLTPAQKEAARRTIVTTGHWENTGDGLGYDWVYSNNIRAVDSFGQPLRVLFTDIKTSRDIPFWQAVRNNFQSSTQAGIPALMKLPFTNALRGR